MSLSSSALDVNNLVGASSSLTPDALYIVVLSNIDQSVDPAEVYDILGTVQPDLIPLGGTLQVVGNVAGLAVKFAHNPKTTAAGPVFDKVEFFVVEKFATSKAIYAVPFELAGEANAANAVGAVVTAATTTTAAQPSGPFGISSAVRSVGGVVSSIADYSKWIIAALVAGVVLYLYLEYRKTKGS